MDPMTDPPSDPRYALHEHIRRAKELAWSEGWLAGMCEQERRMRGQQSLPAENPYVVGTPIPTDAEQNRPENRRRPPR